MRASFLSTIALLFTGCAGAAAFTPSPPSPPTAMHYASVSPSTMQQESLAAAPAIDVVASLRSASNVSIASTGALEEEVAPSAPRPPSPPADQGQSPADTRKFIRNVSLTYSIADDNERVAITRRATALSQSLGGHVSSESMHWIVLRIPSTRLDEALLGLNGIADVSDRSVDVQEVSQQYSDLGVRIRNLRGLRDRLQGLLSSAKEVKEVLEVERELNRVTIELENLETQIRMMENRISLSTVTLSFATKSQARPGPLGWIAYGLYRGVKWLFVWE